MKDSEPIKQLKKLLNVKLNKVSLQDIEWNFSKGANYSINRNKQITGLRINGFELTEVPSLVSKFVDLTHLNLQDNLITDITNLKSLNKLKVLNLKHNLINDISSLEYLKYIEILDLSKNQLENIEILKKLKKINRLNLKHNKIHSISSLKNLARLNHLDLSSNNIESINPIYELIKKRGFNYYLEMNPLNTASLTKIESTKPLIIKQLQQQLGFEIKKVERLGYKKLSWEKKVEYVVDNEGEITGLGIYNIGLENIPKEVLALKKLKILNLQNNQIVEINSLKEIQTLECLDLENNQIIDIQALKKLKHLKKLDLANNKIEDITALKNLKFLEELYIKNNQIKNIDEIKNIDYFTKTKVIFLQGNLIEDITGLSELKQITYLDLNNNKIKDISPLNKLIKLEKLWLDNNFIEDISPLNKLNNLKWVNLKFNPIKRLPEWITDFGLKIKWENNSYNNNCITFYNNPVEFPPLAIVKNGENAIKNYFEQLKDKTDQLFEAKIIIIGEERAGKSTLVDALVNPDFNINFKKETTKGINLEKWIIPKKETGTLKNFRFNIWDFGGQQIYHSIHQFFLTKRSLYLLLFESRKDPRYDDFYFWLSIINSMAENSPIVIIQNKIDQDSIKFSTKNYREAFPQIVADAQQISCNTNHEDWSGYYSKKLISLKKLIYEIIRNKKLKGVGDELPKAWIEIRKEINKLQSSGQNYMSYTDYLKVCSKYDLTEEQANFLSEYFHDLGIFLHFKSDIHLKNTIFLDHNWVTKAVYNVLDNNKIKDKNGKFTDEDLIEIWKEPEFARKQSELLNLMKNKKFKICYQHNDGYYLIPQLFSHEPKDFEWKSNKTDIRIKLKYDFMPKGIISQLIVEMHQYIYKDIFWLNGVVFKYHNSFVLIKENRFGKENTINISANGNFKEEIMVIIEASLNQINKSFSNLNIEKMFACNCKECEINSEPNFFGKSFIDKAIEKGVQKLQCQHSLIDVELSNLPGISSFYKRADNSFQHKEQIISQTIGDDNIVAMGIRKEVFDVSDLALILDLVKNDKPKIKRIKDMYKLLSQYEDLYMLEGDPMKKMYYEKQIEHLEHDIKKNLGDITSLTKP